MRTLIISLAATAAACSQAADPTRADAPFVAVDSRQLDAPPPLRILVINEVAASETPDWFEIVNVGTSPVMLADFAYVDAANDFVKAKPFPSVTLPPGAYYTQDVDDVTSGFKLASDEELWIYRIGDQMLSDAVDWPEGASTAGMSYARRPDRTGEFATGTPSKGLPNP